MDNSIKKQKLFVLDTNILMHDPAAIYHFQEHDIYLPMVVLEELDRHKSGISEVARNVRQTNRTLVELMNNASHESIMAGLPIPSYLVKNSDDTSRGKIFFQTDEFEQQQPISLPGLNVDNTLLATALSLQKKHTNKQIIIVSKDINLRIKAGILGVPAEDYYTDQVLDDVTLLHSGAHTLENNFWDSHAKDMSSWQENGRTFYRIKGPLTTEWHPNDCISTVDGEFKAVVKKVEAGEAMIEMAKDYMADKHTVWGIKARNSEQNFALNLLLDPDVDFVTLQGSAGTGKTLLTIAAGLTQVLDDSRYNEIIMTRVTIPVGEDIGFLPGSEEEKMAPWMGALMDNLEVLQGVQEGGSFGRGATDDLLKNKIKIRSLNYMRGRTFLNRFIIIDEAQNLTPKQMKTLITRAGPGSKIVCLGDIKQIDTPYLSETTSGLTFAVDRFKSWEHSAHITLTRGERSRLADYAANQL
ncbi:MAG: PhoH family protein [Legionellaceae bacterium]|nr:PhoH family protein [Legionellaceae bacterium]